MKRRTRFRGDLQVDGTIFGGDGQPVGGGPPAKITAEANPTALFCLSGAATDVTDWSIDLADGSGISLNDDGIHFDLTAGIYIANVYADVAPVPVGTLIRVNPSGSGAYSDSGPNFVTTYRGGPVGGCMGWFTMDEDGQLRLQVTLYGDSGVPLIGSDATSAQIKYVGFDLLKLS